MKHDHREHVLAGIGHSLIVLESIKQNRKHLRSLARHLERFTGEVKGTRNIEAVGIATAAAKAMRGIADALATAEEANGDACACFGAIVKCDLKP